MVRAIVKDVLFLSQPSEEATGKDLQVGKDLLDTLEANKDRCVGMASNMIGVLKRVIVVNAGIMNLVMFNPVIRKAEKPYETEEGCLSLTGVRKTTRYEAIELEYMDPEWKKQTRSFTGRIAQIVQHEVDHLNGILIYY